MSTLIQCANISHMAGTKALFSGLDLTIDSTARIGLVGHNGAGKSTLLALLGGEPADGGEISRSNDLHLEIVEQFMPEALLDLTLLAALTDKLTADERDFSAYKVARRLAQLGFADTEFDHRVRDLSGGQQNRLMFARAIINGPNLVLFDEPTNHLDLGTLLFFEQFLRNFDAAFLLISHDRQFLDAVTTSTVILRDQRAHHFALPCSAARQRLLERDEADAARRKEEEKSLKSLKASQKRMAEWGKVYDNEKLARKAKSMEKRIVKLEEAKTFVTRGSGLSLSLDVDTSRASRMLQIENRDIMTPSGDELVDSHHQEQGTPLFHIEDIYLRPGDRVALLGHNGAGKTTLIHQIMHSYRTGSDFVKFNPQCQIGYYDQEMAELNSQHTLLDTLRAHCQRNEQDYSAGLIQAGFPHKDFDKRVGVLSGGEKARLMFLMIKLNQPNLLIMDEPTNHIDIQGKEELEAQLLNSQATLLVTSHDRRFVDHIAQRYVVIKGGQLIEINNPDAFYKGFDASSPSQRKHSQGKHSQLKKAHSSQQQLSPSQQPETRDAGAANAPITTPMNNDSDEAKLQRLIDLEALLTADLARKPRFQKPLLQQQWQAEIETLNLSLE
ncbi:MAG: ATP-binding cassette subfamily F protein 3 [Candidatus Azotimanducaceae bacterium]|jgi:ATP-binding cassette subfamily F protein 3